MPKTHYRTSSISFYYLLVGIVKGELISLSATGTMLIQPQYVSLPLLKDWVGFGLIDKTSYIRLVVWLIAGKQAWQVDCEKLAENLSMDSLLVSSTEIKQAISELEASGVCSTQAYVQLSLLENLQRWHIQSDLNEN